MAERTAQSWTTVPHFFVTRDVDATALNQYRERIVDEIESTNDTYTNTRRRGANGTGESFVVEAHKLSAGQAHHVVAIPAVVHAEESLTYEELSVQSNRLANYLLSLGIGEGGLVAIAFCNADQFTRWMGRQGLRGVSKIIALLLDAIAVSFFGSLLSAWRRQLPRRAPGKSVRILLTVLSKPSVRMPRTRYDGSCWDAAR